MFSFLQKESDHIILLFKINPNYSKAKSIGIRPSEPLAVTWIRHTKNLTGLIHSPISARTIIGLSGICQHQSFTIIKQLLDPSNKVDDQSLIANWGNVITKIAPTSTFNNEDV
jgi:hypothetical protein